jgi:2-polyprenyl-6-hydroxyphenyl methylase/3-demethylubiquinone-9 3-methyltransferase
MANAVSGMISPKMLDAVECPACKGHLRIASKQWLVCAECERRYPVRQDIPVLLVSEADNPQPPQSESSIDSASREKHPSVSHERSSVPVSSPDMDAQSAKEDISSETKHFDEYYRETRKLSMSPSDLVWIQKATNPSSTPLDYWEFVFYLVGDVTGKKVLELGCGGGWISRALAFKGASMSAFDISLEGCVSTREKLIDAGFQFDSIAVMDAHSTAYRDSSFDVVFMAGVLHHLNGAKVAREVHRILKPGGRVVGYEPLKYGPVMWAVKQIWLKLHGLKDYETTEHEEGLSVSDLDVFRQLFTGGFTRRFNFVAKTNRLRNRFGPLANSLRWIDYILLSTFPFLRRYCTTVVLCFEKQQVTGD